MSGVYNKGRGGEGVLKFQWDEQMFIILMDCIEENSLCDISAKISYN